MNDIAADGLELVMRVTTGKPGVLKDGTMQRHTQAQVTHIHSMSGLESVLLVGVPLAGSIASLIALYLDLTQTPEPPRKVTRLYIRDAKSNVVVSADEISEAALMIILDRVGKRGNQGPAE
jgi:hypothetical protein